MLRLLSLTYPLYNRVSEMSVQISDLVCWCSTAVGYTARHSRVEK